MLWRTGGVVDVVVAGWFAHLDSVSGIFSSLEGLFVADDGEVVHMVVNLLASVQLNRLDDHLDVPQQVVFPLSHPLHDLFSPCQKLLTAVVTV